jgi:hypothetical protein
MRRWLGASTDDLRGELPNIYHRKQYEAGLDRLPDYRLTCFFVDRNYRREGMAGVALQGALHLIAQAGGGLVEGYPHDTGGQKISASFLYNGTRSLFEQAGFSYVRPKGQEQLRDAQDGPARLEADARREIAQAPAGVAGSRMGRSPASSAQQT